ncbi:MAG: hypothetical protein ACXVKA_06365 [Acidimicrobiia bacterium]
MLSRNSYTQEYIDACRARVDAQVSAYKALARAAAKAKSAPLGSAIDAIEPVIFNNMVVVLDSYFTHRARATEGKDGNALNEVRVLCTSMLENDDRLVADKQIKLTASKSVLGYEVGDEIRVHQADFVRLAKAFFAEIEKKYA